MGFSGYSILVAHSNFRIGWQETAPQSLATHTLDVVVDPALHQSIFCFTLRPEPGDCQKSEKTSQLPDPPENPVL